MIKVITKNVYGNDLLYVTSAHAKWVSQLTGKKTVSESDIEALRELELSVEVIGADGLLREVNL